MNGRTPSHTHDLSALLGRCETAGLPAGMQPLIRMVQCNASVRYDESSTFDAALIAHRASIDLAANLSKNLVNRERFSAETEREELLDLVLSMSASAINSKNGDGLLVFMMADHSIRRLVLSEAHCNWLRVQLSNAMAEGRHVDERKAFQNGRDIRNAPPRHPLSLFLFSYAAIGS